MFMNALQYIAKVGLFLKKVNALEKNVNLKSYGSLSLCKAYVLN